MSNKYKAITVKDSLKCVIQEVRDLYTSGDIGINQVHAFSLLPLEMQNDWWLEVLRCSTLSDLLDSIDAIVPKTIEDNPTIKLNKHTRRTWRVLQTKLIEQEKEMKRNISYSIDEVPPLSKIHQITVSKIIGRIVINKSDIKVTISEKPYSRLIDTIVTELKKSENLKFFGSIIRQVLITE